MSDEVVRVAGEVLRKRIAEAEALELQMRLRYEDDPSDLADAQYRKVVAAHASLKTFLPIQEAAEKRVAKGKGTTNKPTSAELVIQELLTNYVKAGKVQPNGLRDFLLVGGKVYRLLIQHNVTLEGVPVAKLPTFTGAQVSTLKQANNRVFRFKQPPTPVLKSGTKFVWVSEDDVHFYDSLRL